MVSHNLIIRCGIGQTIRPDDSKQWTNPGDTPKSHRRDDRLFGGVIAVRLGNQLIRWDVETARHDDQSTDNRREVRKVTEHDVAD